MQIDRVLLPAVSLLALMGCASGSTASEVRYEPILDDAPMQEGRPTDPPAPSAPSAPSSIELTIAAVGDIMLGSTYPWADGRDLPPTDDRPAGLLTPLMPLLSDADIAFGNLEGAIVAADDATARPKCNVAVKGCFAFRMPPELAPWLVAAGFDVLSMANNHVLDFGEPGRAATRATLDRLGLRYSGQRGDIARWEVKGQRVSLVAFSGYEHVYDLNDLDEVRRVVGDEAARSDVLIVSFHGGGEGPDYQRVAPGAEYFLGRNRGDLRAFAHLAVEAGADLVLGHGPHVVRAIELYRDRLIAYSLGNFATYKRFNLTGPNGLGLLLAVTVDGDGRFVRGTAHALRQLGLGGPELDPGRAVLPTLRKLSREDFPDTGVDVAPDGALLRPGETAPTAPEPPEPIVPEPIVPEPTAPPPGPTAPGAHHLDGVHPHLRALALELHRRALAAGVPFRIVFGYTPYERRTRPGPGGMATWHQFGLAFDVLIADRKDIADGKRHFADDDPAWRTLGAIAAELGLVWGGIWRRSYDPFHFEWHPGDDSTISPTDLVRFLTLAGPDGRDYQAVWQLYPSPR